SSVHGLSSPACSGRSGVPTPSSPCDAAISTTGSRTTGRRAARRHDLHFYVAHPLRAIKAWDTCFACNFPEGRLGTNCDVAGVAAGSMRALYEWPTNRELSISRHKLLYPFRQDWKPQSSRAGVQFDEATDS